MSNIESKLVYLLNGYSVLNEPSIEEIVQYVLPNTSIVLIDEELEKGSILKNLLSINLIKNVLVISKKQISTLNKKIIITSKISKKHVVRLDNNILILINLNNNYEYSKTIVNSVSKLLKLTKEFNRNIYFSCSNKKVIFSTFNKSVYFDDLLNCFNALLIENNCEYIYDVACEYLDKQFVRRNLCDFKNNKCIANREKCINHENMGCCYSFEYSNFFDVNLVKNVKLCEHLKNGICETKNITCKLYTCKYLKNKNIQFNSHEILILDCFFNKKQHLIIQSNFFRTKQEILKKLNEENKDLYFWYVIRRKYMI